MAQPPEVHAVREELARLYRDAQASIDARLAALVADPQQAVLRSRLQARLVELSREVTALTADLDQAAHLWTSERYPTIYGNGADTATGGRFAWTQAHVEAVTELAHDTYSDLLKATTFMRRDAKALIREAGHAAARVALLEGETARRAGEQLARHLADRGIRAVRYSNGALHTIADYSDVVLRSKTAEAYNRGTLGALADAGVAFVEVFDGPDCGWSSHADTDLANRTVRRLAEAEQYVIAHPRCARSFGGRPDVRTAQQAASSRGLTAEEQRRQAREERGRADVQQATSVARRRQAARRRRRLLGRSA